MPLFLQGGESFRRVSLVILLMGSGSILAQDVPDRAGTAEFQYLETLIFARPAGIAGAYTSLVQGEDAIGYNPAGLSKLEGSRSFAGTLRYHFLDMVTGNVAYGYQGSGGRTYAVSAAYMNYGKIPEMDENGNATGKELMPSSVNPAFTMSWQTTERVRTGITGKILSEYLGGFEGSRFAYGWGVDLGVLYQPNVRNLGFGAAILHLGRKEIAHFPGGSRGGMLPAAAKTGMFYNPLNMPKARLVLDLEFPWHDSPLAAGGVEYAYSPAFTVRAGSRLSWAEARHYAVRFLDEGTDDFRGGNALKGAGGFTFLADQLGFDYAVQYWTGLSWVHAMTVRYELK